MKRDYPQQDYTFLNGGSSTSASNTAAATASGFSDMADVAQKIEQLEGVLGNDDGLSQLASDSVHYNPSDPWFASLTPPLKTHRFRSIVVAVIHDLRA